MEKRKQLFLIIISIVLVLIVFNSFANAIVDEQTQIPKTKSWLKNNCMGTGIKWPSLTLEQHVFCFLTIKGDLTEKKENQSINFFVARSQNNQGICWPSNCQPYETALAKLVLDKSGLIESTLTDQWLLNQTEAYANDEIAWRLQISSSVNEVRCLMTYDNINSNNEFEFDSNGILKRLDSSLTSCFDNQTYWLGLKNPRECAKKQFNITCTKPIVANFFFVKDNAWYITTDSSSGNEGEKVPLKIKSSCIADSSGCNYKATLWTALAFYDENPEVARSFIPYLIMEKEGNEALLPAAFLYTLTGKEEYANEIGNLQGSDGLILSTPQSYKYYDTAVAQLTGSVIEPKVNTTKLKQRLLTLQKKEGSYYFWDVGTSNGAGRDNIKDTAMLYLAFWLGYSPIVQNDCQLGGYTCVDNCTLSGGTLQDPTCGTTGLECCSIPQSSYDCVEKYGECLIATSCPSDKTFMNYQCNQGICCKNNSRSMCVSELLGTVCTIDPLKDVVCTRAGSVIPFIRAGDTQYCCPSGGSCVYRNKTCSDLGGEICDPTLGKSCQLGNTLPAAENFCCRIGFCNQGPMTCTQKGGVKCNTGEDCQNGNMVDASDTNGLLTCCINGGTCIRSTCDKTLCSNDQTCDSSSYNTAEGLCCDGNCITELQTCTGLGGRECSLEQKCSGNPISAKDTQRCCMGTCQEKGKFDFTIVIIIVVIVVLIALLFFLIKKLKKKKEDKKDEFGFDEFPPSSSGYRPDKDLGIGTGIPAPKKPSKAIPAPKALSAPKQPTTVPIRPLPKPVKQKEQAKKEIKKKVEEDSDDAFAELEKMSK